MKWENPTLDQHLAVFQKYKIMAYSLVNMKQLWIYQMVIN